MHAVGLFAGRVAANAMTDAVNLFAGTGARTLKADARVNNRRAVCGRPAAPLKLGVVSDT